MAHSGKAEQSLPAGHETDPLLIYMVEQLRKKLKSKVDSGNTQGSS